MTTGGGAAVVIRLPVLLQHVYQAPAVVQVAGTTPRAAILALDGRWPGISDRILEPDGSLRQYLLVFVNEQPAGLDDPLPDGAAVRVVASVAGG